MRTLITLAMLATGAWQTATAQTRVPSTVTVVVGFGVGGGYDIYARTLTRHWAKHLAEAPTFVVRNMPGAGSLVAANTLYNSAPKDGSTIGMLSRSIPTQPLLDNAGVQYDPRRFSWIGSTASETSVVFARTELGFSTIDDLRSKALVAPTSGSSSDSAIYANVLNEFLRTKIKVVAGYKGVGDFLLAIERGEMDGMVGASLSTLKATRSEWLAQKRVRILLQLANTKNAELADVPLAGAFAENTIDAAALALILSRQSLAFPVAAPPDVPAGIVDALRRSFQATLRDPGFLADAAAQQLDVTPSTGAQIAQSIAEAYSAPAEVLARARAVFAPVK